MATIRVEKTLAAPIDGVFELLSDHANYKQFRGVTSSKLIREGTDERNGRGAVRAIATGPIRFEEEITAFERPTRMDYLIRKINVPLRHHGATITLESVGAAARVLWISRFDITVPAVGGAAGRAIAVTFRRGFIWVLDDIERRARR
jgi:uncharacterized protein YndB with AHSA1/START domain